MTTLAHLSDPHLGPLPRAGLRDLLNKRMLGYLNWHRKRQYVHIRGVAEAMVEDIKRQAPDHIAVTGDLVNISLPEEFPAARDWLETLGAPEDVSVVPGNHDAYVSVPWRQSLGLWEAYMGSDAAGAAHVGHNDRFPYVRIRGRMALIGLSTAVPMPPAIAGGRLGKAQLDALGPILSSLGADGYYRVIMIHHPPLPGQNTRRKALTDARKLKPCLRATGRNCCSTATITGTWRPHSPPRAARRMSSACPRHPPSTPDTVPPPNTTSTAWTRRTARIAAA